ncbi:MAG: DUF1622 domain-containing protein [Thermoproteota archaeon]|nr:DUF1622 domain-containing protein [Thermoproteota archaeon]
MSSEILASLRPLFELISIGLEIIGVIIIIYAAIITLSFLIKAERKNRREAGHNQHEIKLQFTTRLLTSLEFFIAADIIKTIASPEPMTLLIVGVTIAIRAVLTFLLHKEQKSQKEGEKKQDQHKQI